MDTDGHLFESPEEDVSLFDRLASDLLAAKLSIAVVCGFATTTHVVTVCAQESPKPNMIIINADDLGFGDLGCYGATRLQTPNIDRLANEGRRFTDAHSSSAVCSPSRYGLLTGRYPLRKNFWGPASLRQGLTIDPSHTV